VFGPTPKALVGVPLEFAEESLFTRDYEAGIRQHYKRQE
jgi:hypothetical protein